jgi:hypothetical protein
MCAEQAACVRRRSWAGFEFLTGTGVIARGGIGADQANTIAQPYCAKYGKHGAMVADYIKEPMFFECVM